MSFPPRTIYSVTKGINSPQTQKKYLYYLNRFMKHFDKSSQEALLDLKDPRYIQDMIIRYIETLAEKGLVYSTIR